MQYTLKCNFWKHSVFKTLSRSSNQSSFLSQLSFTNSSHQETINNLPTALWQDFFFSSNFFFGKKKKLKKKMCCLDSSWSHSTMNWVLFSHGPIFVLSTKSQKQQQNSATHWATCTPKCGGGWCFSKLRAALLTIRCTMVKNS